MKTKSWEVELIHPWESLEVILSEPEKTLPFFPYFESIEGDTVRFKVPRFIFDFGYEFKLAVGFQKRKAIYTFTGDRGILTVTFEMTGSRLRVTASWSGFGEVFMGKPLETFAKGIAKAIQDFCSAQAACPVMTITEEKGIVEHVTPETAPALIKRISWELKGKDFILEGISGDGTVLSAMVRDEHLVELKVKEKEGRETIIQAEVPVLELTPELFEGLPLKEKFEIKVKRI
ncbi:hypothetical protein [Thermococcus piezophilus]|uniref:Uncharacterized protein n=1 Tax=Thermococcus piezophilus TaxID=1712654 RepID=A0A172WIB4_9EURY|nr:hypothetical protein [Thermococcus piezophilus]ANF23150.1 hypothetical protein A7C91_08215 [Thermococcus piezophilus]